MKTLHHPTRLSRRQLNGALLRGLGGLALVWSVPAFAVADREPACSVTAEEMMEAVIGSGGRLLAQYLCPSYKGYSQPIDDPVHGRTYVRHTGRDFGKAPGSPARAVVPGRVVGIMNPHSSAMWQAAVVHDGGSTYWVYGHLDLVVHVGQVINRGQVVGTIANPRGEFEPHVHVTAIKVPYPTSSTRVNEAISWGRAYGCTPGQAEANALYYTDDPLVAFARTRGKACSGH